MKKEHGDTVVEHLTKGSKKKGEKKGGKKLKRMIIEPAKGGHIVHHEYHEHPEEMGMAKEPEQPHVVANNAAMHDHIDEHLPEPEGAEQGEEPVEA